jgi:prolipoprotein diacylglyceryltransferase
MWPVLVSIGKFELTTMSVFGFMAIWLFGFVLWRKAREEHYPEDEVFDSFIISTVAGLIAGRVAHLVLNFPTFGWDPLAWIDVIGRPGAHFAIGALVAGWYFYTFAKKNRWDAFETLDFWVLALTATQAWLSLGTLVAGIGYGLPTKLPWGWVFPGVFEPHHPLQVYWLVTYILLWWYLARVEYKYRLFAWYRAGKSSAQAGFLTATYVIVISVMTLVWAIVSIGATWRGLRLDVITAGVGLVLGAVLMWMRSGQTWSWPWKR